MKPTRAAITIAAALTSALTFTALRQTDAAEAVQGGSLTFEAQLRGGREVPPVATRTRGRAEITFNDERTSAVFELKVEDGTAITQAHLHCAPQGVNGPIVVFLAGFHEQGWHVDGHWIGDAAFTNANVIDPACGADLAALVRAIRHGQVYVNVHSVEHPGGVIRGQLRPAEE